MTKTRAAIIGGAGYTGGELIRLLRFHPRVDLTTIISRSQAGKAVAEIHTDLVDLPLIFSDRFAGDEEIVFLCMGHGESRRYLAEQDLPVGAAIIDLSQDFRLQTGDDSFVYGLPELCREEISRASRVANPGCFATCIQLGLLPLAAEGWLNGAIQISGITGSTGAGQSPAPTTHFSWRNNNISVYKPFVHQHLAEIRQSLGSLQPGFDQDIHFIPYRGGFSRGILCSTYLDCPHSFRDAISLFENYYQHHPFVFVSDRNPDLKQVVNTNNCLVHLHKSGRQLLVISALDNLLKGASGQAVQNMNLMHGFDEDEGLRLKAIGY